MAGLSTESGTSVTVISIVGEGSGVVCLAVCELCGCEIASTGLNNDALLTVITGHMRLLWVIAS